MKETGTEKNELYLLLRQKLPGHSGMADCVLNAKITDKSDLQLWHKRLRNIPYRILCQMFPNKCGSMDGFINKCSICPLAKQVRLAFPISTITSHKPFDLLHMDFWGP